MGRGRTRRVRFALALGIVGVLAVVVVATAAALRFNDTPCIEQGGGGIRLCPSGQVGGNYSTTLTGSGGCGPALPYQYRILNGALPAGLSLSTSGVISGRATASGTADFWVEISDEDPPSQSWCAIPAKAEHEFRIVIAPGLSIETKSLPAGASVGVPYSAPLSVLLLTNLNPPTGIVPGSVAWSVLSGTLPPGVALVNGAIVGTPTTEGTYQFVVKAVVNEASDTETLTMVVRAPLAIQAPKPFGASGLAARWEVGVPFTGKLTGTGGTGTYTWSLFGGALPPGLALAADGTVFGKPLAAGTYGATLRLADDEGRIADHTALFGIAPKLAIRTLRLKAGKVGKAYRAKLKTHGGVAPTRWKIRRGKLPQGVRFASKAGMFVGKPSKAGTYRVTVEVTDALKVKSGTTLLLLVRP